MTAIARTQVDGRAGGLPNGRRHLANLSRALDRMAADHVRLERWGCHLAAVLGGGGRLLAAGNGGSAAQAQHLAAELVGRYRDERPAYAAIALCSDPSSLTALTNDYGGQEAFARQVRAHGRPGDVLVALSTSGRSANVLAAVKAARAIGITTWGLVGEGTSPLAASCDDSLCVDGVPTATVQEVHLVAVHMICAAFDIAVGASTASGGAVGASTASGGAVGA